MLAPGNHDEVERAEAARAASFRLLPPEHLTNPAPGAVAHDGAAKAARGNHAEPVAIEGIGKGKNGHVRGRHASPLFLDERELAASTQADVGTKP